MSGFVIELGTDGVYTKQGGPALLPLQHVLLAEGLFALPQYYEESRGEVLVAREWRIPFGFGHFLVREFLPVADAPKEGWPW
ncbi:TPA: hypothetical protein ACT5B2_003830 [Burkholderia cenocepacia]|uniref:Uncharacterized protein n=1 Tax=Burkholderia cenocepacia TaxID=95486 RepID=A0A1V2W362_9BURK|nr:hypothetical protein [Burkholderia cenocepacia]MBR8248672.1 hypothetical protein [Burkholderia cenocepacia]MBR8288846.1 hypothetical protein [Burkholderia cenocepacia]MBR8497115.1 hypothetical protein [Burkholderia cenocepacia]MDN7456574.1 hypothetical protein [Burkholderia cenocepacia]ONJ13683.1 hypothetical protein A8D83_11995 [Burkholderia cenocepacia]